VLGGKIVEGQQRLAIFLEAFGGFLVFDGVGLDEPSSQRELLKVVKRDNLSSGRAGRR
jgi:hypothetical protein